MLVLVVLRKPHTADDGQAKVIICELEYSTSTTELQSLMVKGTSSHNYASTTVLY
jgi:hypothetical protein